GPGAGGERGAPAGCRGRGRAGQKVAPPLRSADHRAGAGEARGHPARHVGGSEGNPEGRKPVRAGAVGVKIHLRDAGPRCLTFDDGEAQLVEGAPEDPRRSPSEDHGGHAGGGGRPPRGDRRTPEPLDGGPSRQRDAVDDALADEGNPHAGLFAGPPLPEPAEEPDSTRAFPAPTVRLWRRKRKNSTPSRSRRRMMTGSRTMVPSIDTIFRGRK